MHVLFAQVVKNLLMRQATALSTALTRNRPKIMIVGAVVAPEADWTRLVRWILLVLGNLVERFSGQDGAFIPSQEP